MKTLKAGIISANWGAFAHLPGWHAIPGSEVLGICTSRRGTAEAAAEHFRVARPCRDAEAMVAAPSIDIVDCGTRPDTHHAMVLAAPRNGGHVYDGIPFAAGFVRSRRLRSARNTSGGITAADALSQWRSLPASRIAQ